MPAATQDDDNLWGRILVEVQSKSTASLPQSSLLVLGENEAGKTSLLARLQRKDEPKKGAGMEYHFLEVNPDYSDDVEKGTVTSSYAYQLSSALPDMAPGESFRLGVWMLDGDKNYAPLLKFALRNELISHSCVLLTASMAEPWSILESLNKWANILNEYVRSPGNFDAGHIRENTDRQCRFWQEYVEPLDSSSHSDNGAKVPSMDFGQDSLLPLAEDVLTNNIGLPIIVVITKCDAMSTVLEKEYDYKDEHFDFIQYHIRKFCLSYGAALVYTSSMDQRNCATLYKYILHRVYGFPFTQPASVVEKESVFIPAGWDNAKKISILHENWRIMKPDDPFSTHIVKPTLRRPTTRESELVAEEDQTFLQRVLPAFNAAPNPADIRTQTAPTVANAESPLPSRLSRVAGSTSPNLMRSTSPKPKQPSMDAGMTRPSGLVAAPGQAPENSTLAHFFNNLLKNKPGTGGPAPPATNGTTPNAKSDKAATEAELARLQKKTQEIKNLNSSMDGADENQNETMES